MGIKDHNFIFIAGLHRSGTTMLQHILREHPDISGFKDTGAPEDEGQHLQDVFPAVRDYGGPGRFCLSADVYRKAIQEIVSEENAEKIFRSWQPYWNLEK